MKTLLMVLLLALAMVGCCPCVPPESRMAPRADHGWHYLDDPTSNVAQPCITASFIYDGANWYSYANHGFTGRVLDFKLPKGQAGRVLQFEICRYPNLVKP